eukprot:6182714-Pleurochrysis_carterae.AAC.1
MHTYEGAANLTMLDGAMVRAHLTHDGTYLAMVRTRHLLPTLHAQSFFNGVTLTACWEKTQRFVHGHAEIAAERDRSGDVKNHTDVTL